MELPLQPIWKLPSQNDSTANDYIDKKYPIYASYTSPKCKKIIKMYELADNVIKLEKEGFLNNPLQRKYNLVYNAVTLEYTIPNVIFLPDITDIGGDVMEELINQKYIQHIYNCYNFGIYALLALSILFALVAYINPPFFPRQSAISSIVIFTIGILGLYVDKIRWKENNK